MKNKQIKVGSKVWTVHDPLTGILDFPSEDVVQEVNHSTDSYLLTKHNHIEEDYYGNLVPREYLYGNKMSAAYYLLGYYEKELSLAKSSVEELNSLVSRLNTFLERGGEIAD